MAHERPKTFRCAIYTRKSSEEGLEQDFNSLHAQREACEAYIKSQMHEGWRALPDQYDDGGYSGGTMERPALQKLLADVHAGKVDVVVVYKVDRLTRALNDFARIVDVFDSRGASFVSVTQQFNTTTSMGRLTLNVLLSFAQFEREVTGERIRDKIAASKKKGMWMGGVVPIGYDARDRSLVINEADACTVREIFCLYLELASVQRLQTELDHRGIRTKRYVTEAGRTIGDRHFSRGHLYKLLSNPIYLGEIQHRGIRHIGLHPAIIDRETWEAVQLQLAANTRARLNGTTSRFPSLFAGLLFDSEGNRFVTTHATKNGKRYRYYLCEAADDPLKSRAGVMRYPAGELEPLVISAIASTLRDERAVLDGVGVGTLQPIAIKSLLAEAARLASAIEHSAGAEGRAAILSVVERMVIERDALHIHLRSQALSGKVAEVRCPGMQNERPFVIECPLGPTRLGGEIAHVMEGPANGTGIGAGMNPAELKAVARGFVWFEELTTGRARSADEIAKREGVTDRYVSRLVDHALAFAEASVRPKE